MNVMLTEYQDNPKRKTAAPSFNPVVEEKINQEAKNMIIKNFGDPEIENKLFKDLGDSINFDQSCVLGILCQIPRFPMIKNHLPIFAMVICPLVKKEAHLLAVKTCHIDGQEINMLYLYYKL